MRMLIENVDHVAYSGVSACMGLAEKGLFMIPESRCRILNYILYHKSFGCQAAI
jgi:hypothetical protein